jgi:hypothetical protein
MDHFSKNNINETNVPDWASFFDSNEYAAFIEEIDNYFKSLNLPYEIADGAVFTDETVFGFSNLGLVNMAQVCKQAGPAHYKEIIADHFGSVMRINQFEKEFSKIADNFEEVKKHIGVRLYNKEHVSFIGEENVVGKDFAGDIYAMLIFDLPDSVKNITPGQLPIWNKTADELFDIGIENIKNNYPFSISREDFGEFQIWFAHGNHFFTPNIVFDMENRPELVGSKGALIGLPHRHAALIYPIENLEVIKAIHGLIATTYGMNLEGPGSLSNNLFWYKDKTWTVLPYFVEDERLQIHPPESFLELLNELK